MRSNGFPGMNIQRESIDINDLIELTPLRETAIGPIRRDEDLELEPETENVNENHEQPQRRKRCSKLCGLCIVCVVVFGCGFVTAAMTLKDKGSHHADPDGPRPRTDSLQQINALSSFDNNSTLSPTKEPVSHDLDYLERLGLKFFVSASNSTCPQEVCHTCTTTVFKDSAPSIEPEGDCNHTRNTKNASCYMCLEQCYNFTEVLNGMSGRCSRSNLQASCADLTKMAKLNNYCHGGDPVFDKDRSNQEVSRQLRCICPHGQSGERCENVSETENVACSCYKNRFRLQETQPEFNISMCERVSYTKDTRCLHFTKNETCYCVSIKDSDPQQLFTSCDILDTNSDDSKNDDNANGDDNTTDDSLNRESRDASDANMGRQTNHGERNSLSSSLQLLVVFALLRTVLLCLPS